MDDRRRSRAILAVLTLVAIVLITIDFREDGGGPLDTLRRGALTVFAPVQDGFSTVAGSIGGFFGDVRDYASLRSTNERLEEEVRALQGELPSVRDLERENAELRALLGMRERLELETLAARVIGEAPGQRSHTILIDVGADDGVVEGMAVINAQGLVGKVVLTTSRHAKVELLTSPTARYAGRVAETAESGLLRGAGAFPFRFELLDPEAQAAVGAEVVTRTFQGSTIPDGLPVGEVADRSEVAQTEGTVSPRYHLVRPYVDFRRLSIVQVVLNAPDPPPDLNASDDPDDSNRPDADGDEDDEDTDQGADETEADGTEADETSDTP